MGLREILTTPIGAGSSKFQWREPAAYRIRLRGDLWLRVAVALGAWAFGTGVFGLLFANNVHRPGFGLAIGLGSLFGLVAMVLVFLLRDHVSGRVKVDDDEIRRQRQYASISPGSWVEWQSWPYGAIESCAVVPASAIGKSFAVLVLTADGERDVVGVPGSVDLAKLAKFLTARGVQVSQAKAVPRQATGRLNPIVATAVPALGVILLVVGVGWLYSSRKDVAGPPGRPEGFPVANADRGEINAPQIVTHDGPPSNTGSPPPQPAAGQNAPGIGGPGFGGPQFGFGGPPGGNAPPGVPQPVAPGQPPAGVSVPQGTEAGGKGRKTDVVGAPGGFDFERTRPGNPPVTGFRSVFGSWAGKQWIGRLEPLYGGEQAVPNWNTVQAKPGYAVAGLLVDTPEFVNAYAVVFQRLRTDGTLDAEDAYTSEWIGPKSETAEKTLTSSGKKVLGIHGRAGAILNAVGLIVSDE